MEAVIQPLIHGNGTPEQAWRESGLFEGIPALSVAGIRAEHDRLVLVAPHPDDEILPCAGLLMALGNFPIAIVSVTDGEACYPDAQNWTPRRLSAVRPAETQAALACLKVRAEVTRLGLPDGIIAAHAEDLRERLDAFLSPGDLLLTTWRHDGHPDHESCAKVCRDLEVGLLEMPIWGWHWCDPTGESMPLEKAFRLDLSSEQMAMKREAIEQFKSQIDPEDPSVSSPILTADILARFERPFEIFFR